MSVGSYGWGSGEWDEERLTRHTGKNAYLSKRGTTLFDHRKVECLDGRVSGT